MSITGLPGQGPVRVGIPVADLTAGLFCALGILTALLEREVSGEGQWVATSLLQAQIFMLDFQAARWLQMQRGGQAGRQQSSDPIPTGVFKTNDGHINIAATGQVMWERLCKAIGAPELIEHPDYKSGALRSQEPRRAQRRDRQATVGKTSAEWIDVFNKAGVPCGPIYSIDQVFADPQVKHLGIAQDAKRPDGSDADLRRPAVHAVAHAAARSSPRRRSSASTPTRCSRNSASATNEIAALASRPRRSEEIDNERERPRPTRCCPARRAASAI